jgi:predicted nucleic acid-binding protein
MVSRKCGQTKSLTVGFSNPSRCSLFASTRLRAAKLAAELRVREIGFADFQIAAAALEDGAELLTFNREHFSRVPGLKLATRD